MKSWLYMSYKIRKFFKGNFRKLTLFPYFLEYNHDDIKNGPSHFLLRHGIQKNIKSDQTDLSKKEKVYAF